MLRLITLIFLHSPWASFVLSLLSVACTKITFVLTSSPISPLVTMFHVQRRNSRGLSESIMKHNQVKNGLGINATICVVSTSDFRLEARRCCYHQGNKNLVPDTAARKSLMSAKIVPLRSSFVIKRCQWTQRSCFSLHC